MKVLVIEDETPLAKMIASWLIPMGFEVSICATIAAAMEIIHGEPKPEIITLDLNLPDSTAFQTVERIAEIVKVLPDCLIVVLSGLVTDPIMKRAYELGAHGVIEKGDIRSEKTFWQKLLDVMQSAIRIPSKYRDTIPLMEKMAERAAQRIVAATGGVDKPATA